MTGFVMLMATATVGIDYGWQPIAGGGFEYIIQIEPEMLDSLKKGTPIFSQLPPDYRGIRGYRITVGNGPVPNQGKPPPAALMPATEKQTDPDRPRGGGTTTPGAIQPEPGSQPLAAQRTGYQESGGSADAPKSPSDGTTKDAGASPSDLLPAGFNATGDAPALTLGTPQAAALVALFASVGVNLFLVWVTVAQRGRYRSMAARLAVR